MRLRNTSGIDNDLARKIINFVRPSGLSKFDVMLKNSSHPYGGMAYYIGLARQNSFLSTIRRNLPDIFPLDGSTIALKLWS